MESKVTSNALKTLRTTLDFTPSSPSTSETTSSQLPLDLILEIYQRCVSLCSTFTTEDQREFSLLSWQIRSLASSEDNQDKIRKVVGHFFHCQQADFTPAWITDDQAAASSFLTSYIHFPSAEPSAFLELDAAQILGAHHPHCLSKIWMFLQGTYEPSNNESILDLLSLHLTASYFGISTLCSLTEDLIIQKLSSITEEEAFTVSNDIAVQTILYSRIESIEDPQKKKRFQNIVKLDVKTASLIAIFLLIANAQMRGMLIDMIRSSNCIEDSLLIYQFLREFDSTFPFQIYLEDTELYLDPSWPSEEEIIGFYLALDKLDVDKPPHPIVLTLCSSYGFSLLSDSMKARIVSLSFQDVFTYSEIAMILQATPNLRDLSLYRWGITGDWPKDISLNLPHLKRFSPPKNLTITDLVKVLRAFPSPEKLDLSGYEKIIPASSLAILLTMQPDIETLDLAPPHIEPDEPSENLYFVM